MPIPKPSSGQSESDFMSVCMTFLDKEKSKYPEHKQRVAICLETYRRKNESDDDLIKRLEMMINDTTVTGDVAKPQGQVIGMQYRKKKKKVKGGASYPVHESNKGSEVYDNPKGETAYVSKQGKGYYADVNNEYDKEFKNKSELNKWLKKEKWELVGYE